MRKFLVIGATIAAFAAAPTAAQAHDDRVGVFVVGAVTGAIVHHVLSDHGHRTHVYHHRAPRVVEHHHHYHKAPPRRVREVHHYHHKAKGHGRHGHVRHIRHYR